jgi:SH3-like domain-containing protein
VNVRTGPGVRYPIDWIFHRKAMPVELLDAFETWRKIRDWEGGIGWVHQSMLSGRRMIMVTGAVRAVRARPDPQAEAMAQAEPGVVGRLLECSARWCRVELGGQRGWLLRNEFWGVYPEEKIE